MARFSERIGVKPPKAVLQLDSMDDDLRNGLWNAASLSVLNTIAQTLPLSEYRPFVATLLRTIWADFLKKPVDTIPGVGEQTYNAIRQYLFSAQWSEVYDFIEFLGNLNFPTRNEYITLCNEALERERSAYRFVGTQITPISNEQELAAVQKAMELPDLLKPVRLHLKSAVELFSDRKYPDYRNSIKESISAVEAMCRIITADEKATLGQALKKLEQKGVALHAALKNSFSSPSGYTNDADGIRHALLEESTLDFDDAKFMLVSCSAFVNYLAAKAAKAGVIANGKFAAERPPARRRIRSVPAESPARGTAKRRAQRTCPAVSATSSWRNSTWR